MEGRRLWEEELVFAARSNDLAAAREALEHGASVNCRVGFDVSVAIAVEREYWELAQFLVDNGADVNLPDRGGGTPLVRAVRYNNLARVLWLIEAGAQVNAVDSAGWSALSRAISVGGNVGILRALIAAGANVNARFRDGGSMIMAAIARDDAGAVRCLIEAGADLNSHLDNGKSLLVSAAHRDNFDILQALIDGGVQGNIPSRDSTTAVVAAAASQAWNAVRFLVEAGADANAMMGSGETLLRRAARFGQMETLQCLVEHGAQVSMPSGDGTTAVVAAAENGKWSAVQFLVKAGADANALLSNGNSLIMLATERGEVTSIQHLVRHGADPNAVMGNGDTPLVYAARRGDLKASEALVEGSATVNGTSRDGMSPIMAAIRSGAGPVVRYLLQNGADVNVVLEKRAEVLAHAIRHGDPETIRALVDGGALVNNASEDATAALMETSSITQRETESAVILFLVENDADVNAELEDGETLLADVAERGKVEIVRVLLEHGATVNASGRNGTTAVIAAAQSNSWSVVQVLLEGGANPNSMLENGDTLLIRAANHGGLEVLQTLIICGAQVSATAQGGTTAVMAAAMAGRGASVRFLVENGADATTILKSGETLLAFVAQRGGLVTVQTLIEHGADMNAASQDGTTAIVAAAMAERWSVVEFLLENGADATTMLKSGETLLAFVAQCGGLTAVQKLVERGADVNAASQDGTTAIVAAAMAKRWSVVEFLLENGADASTVLKDGTTMFEHAASCCAWSVAGCIIKSGSPVVATRRTFQKVLWNATLTGQFDVVNLCVENGADPSAVLENGDSLLLCAVKGSKWKTAGCLIDCGADVNAIDNFGRSVLMHAARRGGLDTVRRLIDSGADANAKDPSDRSAFLFAASNGHRAVQRLLMPYTRQVEEYSLEATSSASDSESQSWYISPFEISLKAFVGAKSIGGEYRAKWLDADVVVKLFVPGASSATFAEEVTAWHRLRHPNVIKLYGACDLGHHFFVCELASNGSLIEFLARADVQWTPWKFLHEAALGLAYLHERGIIHGNLRGSNILIGDDGMAKLAEFGMSGSAKLKRSGSSSGLSWELERWHSPERVSGKQASFAADIYSLGLSIIEVLTGREPWAGERDKDIKYKKEYWTPDSESSYLANDLAPSPLVGELRDLSVRLCAWNPEQRLSASSVAQILQDYAEKEAMASESFQPDPEPMKNAEQFEHGKLLKLWKTIEGITMTNGLQRCALEQLSAIHQKIFDSSWPYQVLLRYRRLLDGFIAATQPDSCQNRILQLSSTRATRSSFHEIQRSIDGMWALLGVPPGLVQERRRQWEEERSQQLEIFVSEVSQTLLLLGDMDGKEDLGALLALLESEINAPTNAYTASQLAVLKNAHSKIVEGASASVVTTTQPWFVPWYELAINTSACLGIGGFGCVYRAKWLDSDVVVKQVKRLGAESDSYYPVSMMSSSQEARSEGMSRARSMGNKEERSKIRQMFEREVAVWFGLSHPHVVRLFGACPVGVPCFACEYAGNGSLDKYLRKHPTELCTKLYETALGVQYLQARGIIHGDLKCNNIMVGNDGKAKVTDFGLSSEIEDVGASLTGAWQWVAPECLKTGASMRSFESDVYALGMCVVEALRVVLAATVKKDDYRYVPLPWGDFDNSVVKYHVLKKRLPQRPELCPDAVWSLIERMCSYKSADRIKISTVVDELAQLAGIDTSLGHTATATSEDILTVIADMKAACATAAESLRRTFGLLWDRLEHISTAITSSDGDVEVLRPIVNQARECTAHVETGFLVDTQRIEAAFRGYDLHRRLDKLIEAHFWSVNGEGGEIHQWQSACKSLFVGPDVTVESISKTAAAATATPRQDDV